MIRRALVATAGSIVLAALVILAAAARADQAIEEAMEALG